MAGRITEKGLHLQVTAALMDKIVTEGCDRAYGARPLRRAVTRLVADALSDALLGGALAPGDVARLDVDAEGRTVVTALKPAAASTGPPAGEVRSEVVYSSLSKRRAARAASKAACRRRCGIFDRVSQGCEDLRRGRSAQSLRPASCKAARPVPAAQRLPR